MICRVCLLPNQYLLDIVFFFFCPPGKQETGTKVAAFCAHALLALEILIHPRALPLVHAPVTDSSALDEQLIHNHENLNVSINDLYDDDDDDLYNSWLGDEPRMEDNNAATTHIENQEQPMEVAVMEKNSVDEQVRGDTDAEASKANMHTADVEMASADRDANIDTHQEPASGNVPEVDKEDLRFTSGPSDNSSLGTPSNLISGSSKIEPGILIGGTSESVGVLFKEREGTDYDSDSSSIGSLPEIVAGDPDSDD